MPRWLRRIYNTVASFNLSNALRATCLGGMDRRGQHLHTKSDKPNKRVKSDKSCKSNQSNQSDQYGGTCHRNRDTDCSNRDHCYVNKCRHGKNPDLHVEGCICSVCRDFNEYASASRSTEGQGASTRIRLSNEPRSFKQPNPVATRTDIESVTGIPTGTAV